MTPPSADTLIADVPPPSSSLPETMDAAADHDPYVHHLAQRVAHNLQHQHQWTSVVIHGHSPKFDNSLFPRPIISGLPPQRIYIHPDEQIELLKEESKRRAEAKQPKTGQPHPESEWVLPAHLKEKWTLKKFAEVFDRIGGVPADLDTSIHGNGHAPKPIDVNKWRTVNRVLLATVNDDGTIVYYIIHDGIVKPRQN